MNRSRLAALSAGAMFLVASVFVPATAFADTGNTNTIKVIPATTTISPVGTGSSFTVNVVANGSAAISGAGTGLSFDNTKLQLTAIAKDATEVADGVSYLGFPASGAPTTTFIANANSTGQIPNISWSYLDGASNQAANTDWGIYSATFNVIATGDSTIAPASSSSPAILSGLATGYGTALTPLTLVNGTVVNHLAPVFSISATPSSRSVNQGSNGTVTINTGVVSGTPGNISLSASGLPSGVTAGFSPAAPAAGSSSTLTLTASPTATAGTSTVTVTGVDSADSTDTHSTTFSLTIVTINDYSLSASPASLSVTAGNNATTTVSVTEITPVAGSVTLSTTGILPSGVSASFSPAAATTTAPSVLTLSTTAAATPGTFTITVSGSNGTNTRTTTVTLTVNAPAPPNGQNVTVSGSLAGGFVALTCPTSVVIPLVRGNTNQINVPCVINSNSVWNLNVNDAVSDAYTGFMVTGRPVANTNPTGPFSMPDSMHALASPYIDVAGNTAYHNDVNLVAGGTVLSGTNAANAPVVLSQFVAARTHPGAYGIQLVWQAVSLF